MSADIPPAQGRWERLSRRLAWGSAILLALVVGRNGWMAWQYQSRMRAVRCDQPVFDFGTAFEQQVIDHTFRVMNVSRGPLVIERVNAACGCTTLGTPLAGEVVAPGASIDVPVRLALSAAEAGDFQRPVTIEFTGEPILRVKLVMKGAVERQWTWSPQKPALTGLHSNESRTLKVNLTQHRGAPMATIEHLSLSGRLLRGDLRRIDPQGDGGPVWEITLTTVPPLPMGRTDTTLYATASDASSMIGPIPVTLIVEE